MSENLIKKTLSFLVLVVLISVGFVLCSYVGNFSKEYFERTYFVYGVTGAFIWGILEMFYFKSLFSSLE